MNLTVILGNLVTQKRIRYIDKQSQVQYARAETGKKRILMIYSFNYLIGLWLNYQIIYPSWSHVAACIPIIFNGTNRTLQIIFLINYQLVWLFNSKQVILISFDYLSIINWSKIGIWIFNSSSIGNDIMNIYRYS